MLKHNKKYFRGISLMTVLAVLMTTFTWPVKVVESKTESQNAMEAQSNDSSYELNNPRISEGVTTWDCVYFGNYWQNDTNGDGKADKGDNKQPIKWRVLSVNGDDAFLLADENLDAQPYNISGEGQTWKTCSLHTWINNSFYYSAFSLQEQEAIRNTTLKNDDGKDTIDAVFIPSMEEISTVEYGFDGDCTHQSKTRESKNTAYAIQSGAKLDTRAEYAGNGVWWLRDAGRNIRYAGDVSDPGSGFFYSQFVKSKYIAIRPALHLKVSSKMWKAAGTVSSDGSSTVISPEATNEPAASMDPKLKKYYDKICKAMPNLSNLGSAELRGPQITLGSNEFELFKQPINVDLPFFNPSNIIANINREDGIVQVQIGVETEREAAIESDPDNPDDAYWSKSYNEIKSFVNACGVKTKGTKLWNKFSKLRGRLKKINGSAAFHVEGNVAGYAEFQIDEEGNIIGFNEGGICAGLEAGGSVKVPLWWIVYSEFGVSGTVDGKISLTVDSGKMVASSSGNLGISVKPGIALGADATVIDVKGGIEGNIGGEVEFPWKSMEDSVSAYLTGKLYMQADTILPGLSASCEKEFDKLELYPNLGKVTKTAKKFVYKRSKAVSKKQVRSLTNSKDLVDSPENSIIYENAKPTITTLADGTILMAYLDDTVEAAKGQTTLMYRLYQDGTWSEAKAVDLTGRLDTAAKLISHEGTVYVMYENSDTVIDEDMTQEEILQHLTLKVAQFNETDKTFEKVTVLQPAGSAWSYHYDFAANDTELYAVWAENASGNVSLEEGKTKIYRSKFADEKWADKEEVYRTNDTISDFAYGYTGKKFSLALAGNQKLVVNGTVVAEADSGMNGVKMIEGDVYFIQDGTLMRYTSAGLESMQVACNSSYEIFNDDVYWIGQDNFLSEVYKQKMCGNSVCVAITDDGGYVGGFALAKYDGSMGLIYTEQKVDSTMEHPYGVTVLKYKKNLEHSQAEVTNVAYDVLSFEKGKENSLDITVANTGTNDLNNVNIIVKDSKDNVMYEGAFSNRITAGMQKEKTIPIMTAEDISTLDISIEVMSDETYENKEQFVQNIEVVKNDISITEKDEDTISVKNNADSEAKNVALVVKDGNENGNIIHSENLGNLEKLQEKEISISNIWEKASLNNVTETKNMYFEVKQQDTEYELWNNSITMKKQVPKESIPTPTVTPTHAATPRPTQTATPKPT